MPRASHPIRSPRSKPQPKALGVGRPGDGLKMTEIFLASGGGKDADALRDLTLAQRVAILLSN